MISFQHIPQFVFYTNIWSLWYKVVTRAFIEEVIKNSNTMTASVIFLSLYFKDRCNNDVIHRISDKIHKDLLRISRAMQRQWKGGEVGIQESVWNFEYINFFSKYWHAKLCWTPPSEKKNGLCFQSVRPPWETCLGQPLSNHRKKIKDNISENTVFVCWIATIIKWICIFKEFLNT